MRGQKPAFTLAEVLITLAVIGIVAALTIGIFLPKIHSTIRARQIATAEVKFTKAMEQMALNNAIGPYYDTTQEFVDELQNYLKISKVCANDKLEDCFGYDTIKLDDNEEMELSWLTDGSLIALKNESADFSGEPIGIVTIDGTSMLLSWNKNCPRLDPGMYPWSDDTNIATSCVAALIDVNGNEKPNKMGRDIVLLNALGLGEGCGIEFTYDGKDYCWTKLFPSNVAMTSSECNEQKAKLGIKNCRSSNNDYWGGAVRQCGGTKNMPSMEDLANFASCLYNIPAENKIGTYEKREGIVKDNSKLSASLPSTFYLWSGKEYTASAIYFRYFASKSTTYYQSSRSTSTRYGVCTLE